MSQPWAVAVAASDAVLAAVAIWVGFRILLTALPPLLRLSAATASVLTAAAAVLGCLRYAGLESVATLHTGLSNQSAILGLPLILTASAWGQLSKRIPQKLLVWGSTLTLTVITVIQMRAVSGVLAIALALATFAASEKRRAAPLILLVSTLILAAVAATHVLNNEVRLIALHIALAVLLLASLATIQNGE